MEIALTGSPAPAARVMSIEALPFVNWIFWAALSAGTLLVVGVTELLGGTTSGYRLFMAWLLAAFAAVLLLSELNLSDGTALDASTAGTRRVLVLAFVSVTAAYLVASMARLPRSGLAIAGGLVGVMALATLAAGSPPSARCCSASSWPWPPWLWARSTPPCCSATGTWSPRSSRRRRCAG